MSDDAIEIVFVKRIRALEDQPASPFRPRQVIEPGHTARLPLAIAEPYLKDGSAERVRPRMADETRPTTRDINAPHRADPDATHRALKRFRLPAPEGSFNRRVVEQGDLIALDDEKLITSLEDNGDIEVYVARPTATEPEEPETPKTYDLNSPHNVERGATHVALNRFRLPAKPGTFNRRIVEAGDRIVLRDDELAEKLELGGDVKRLVPRRAPAPPKTEAPPAKAESKAKDAPPKRETRTSKPDAPASKPE